MTSKTRGYVTAWSLDLSSPTSSGPLISPTSPRDSYLTPTSGGKANAIEWTPRYNLEGLGGQQLEQDLLVLTDDEQGYILVMEWDGSDLKEMARTKLPGKSSEDGVGDEGASHAVWLS